MVQGLGGDLNFLYLALEGIVADIGCFPPVEKVIVCHHVAQVLGYVLPLAVVQGPLAAAVDYSTDVPAIFAAPLE